MKSIYEHINENLKADGFLKEEFSLDMYFKDTNLSKKRVLGENDALTLYSTVNKRIKEDRELVEFIEKELMKIDETNTFEIAKEMLEYMETTKKKVLVSLNAIENVSANIDTYHMIDMATELIKMSKNVEATKLGIILLGLVDLTDFPDIVTMLKELALCDEFTLFAVNSLKELADINDIKFMLIKRVNGWGKIHLVNSIDVLDEDIKEWLIINGCKNTIHKGYTAYTLVQKIDLLEVLTRDSITSDEFSGVSDIIEGLLDSGPVKGVVLIDKNEIIKEYLKHFEAHLKDVKKYTPMLLIYLNLSDELDDLEEDVQLSNKVYEIIASDNLKEKIRKNILEDENLFDAILFMLVCGEIQLYDEVYERFKCKPKKYWFCIEYLMKSDEYREKALKLLMNALKLKERYEEPMDIMTLNDTYGIILENVVVNLAEYPFVGNEFIIAGLKTRYAQVRKATLKTIKKWMELSNKKIEELPNEVYKALIEVQRKEFVPDCLRMLNEMLFGEVKGDNAINNEKKAICNKVVQIINCNLFSEKIDSLFDEEARKNGEMFFIQKNILSCDEVRNGYNIYMQESYFGDENKVKITVDNGSKVTSMKCTCDNQSFCMHEYGAILYLRNRLKAKDNK